MRTIIKKIRQYELEYEKIFAEVIIKPYGLIYYNINNKTFYDGNHAFIVDKSNLDESLLDIIEIYKSLGITPRLYSTLENGELVYIKAKLDQYGFNYQTEEVTYMIQNGSIFDEPKITIHRLNTFDEFHGNALLTEEEKEYTPQYLNENLKSKDYYLYVGYVNNYPVTMCAMQHIKQLGVSRIDDVVTVKKYQGNGYAHEILKKVINFHNDKIRGLLHLYTDNPIAIKVYQDLGFIELKDKIERWSAWKNEKN